MEWVFLANSDEDTFVNRLHRQIALIMETEEVDEEALNQGIGDYTEALDAAYSLILYSVNADEDSFKTIVQDNIKRALVVGYLIGKGQTDKD